MKPHAEHQQHHTDFGQLGSNMHVGHKTRCRRADDDARNQVAHQRRNLDAFGDDAQDQGHSEAGSNRGDQGNVVYHALPLLGLSPRLLRRGHDA